MVHCVDVDCVNNTRGGNKNISFYRLPTDNRKRENLPNQNFEDSCFKRDLKGDIHVLLNNQTLGIF